MCTKLGSLHIRRYFLSIICVIRPYLPTHYRIVDVVLLVEYEGIRETECLALLQRAKQ